MTTLAMTAALWDELLASLEERNETAGFLIVGSARSGDQVTLLARSVIWVPEDGYLIRESNRLEIASDVYVPALKTAADDGSSIVFFHTHPGMAPEPSDFDLEVDAGLRRPAQIRTETDLYGSLILGGATSAPAFTGRLFIGEESGQIQRLRVVGNGLRIEPAYRGEEPSDAEAGPFDRQVRAFGRAGQAVLSGLHVGVVGAGGTGSAVSELLMRLGVGRLTVVDDDRVSSTNLTRIHESGYDDIGRSKVSVLKEAAGRIGLGTETTAVEGRITDLAVAHHLDHCDLIFGCTDDNAGRAVLSRFAYWYLAPVIDTAFLVDTHGGAIRGLFGRLTVVAPGTPCLFCRGRIDQSLLMAEGLDEGERERLAGEGYVPGLGEPDPSVGTYTTLVAATAVAEFIQRLFAIGDEQAPSELLLRPHERAVNALAGSPQAGHYCDDSASWGRGDDDPHLGQLWPGSPAA